MLLLPTAPAAAAAAAAACTWTPASLPTLGGQAGGVVGTDGDHRFAGVLGNRPVVWVPGRVVVLSDQRGVAQDVNRSGLAVGTLGETPAPVLWRGRTAIRLAVPRGQQIAEVTGINDAGIIVGTSWVTLPDFSIQPHGLVWDARTPGHVLDVTPAHHYLWLDDVSDRGVLVGTLDPYGGVSTHAVFPRGVMGNLRSGFRLLPYAADRTTAQASTGRYVAGSVQGAGWSGPVVWVDGVTPVRLLGGGGGALAVNSHLLVAGLGSLGDNSWVWDRGVRSQLRGPTGEISYVTSVTEHGEVAGDAGGTPTVWSCR